MTKFRSKKLLEGARDQACVYCGAKDGTVVAAHYQGFRSHYLGKGKGTKVSDLYVADLCSKCHEKFDRHQVSEFEDSWMRKIDQSEQFLYCVLRTLERRVKQGILKL